MLPLATIREQRGLGDCLSRRAGRCLLAVVGPLAVISGVVVGACAEREAHAGIASPIASLMKPQVSLALTPIAPTRTGPSRRGAIGYAISWPQCGAPLPAAPFDFGIVGVTNGAAFTRNPCFADEYRWARAGRFPPAVYWNVNYVECGTHGQICDPYAYGLREAEDAYDYARSHGADPSTWWLDIQTASTWSVDTARNARAIAGAMAFFRDRGLRAGISSTRYQFSTVAGGLVPGLTSWVAGRAGRKYAQRFCEEGDTFAGRETELTAFVAGGFETVVACGRP